MANDKKLCEKYKTLPDCVGRFVWGDSTPLAWGLNLLETD